MANTHIYWAQLSTFMELSTEKDPFWGRRQWAILLGSFRCHGLNVFTTLTQLCFSKSCAANNPATHTPWSTLSLQFATHLISRLVFYAMSSIYCCRLEQSMNGGGDWKQEWEKCRKEGNCRYQKLPNFLWRFDISSRNKSVPWQWTQHSRGILKLTLKVLSASSSPWKVELVTKSPELRSECSALNHYGETAVNIWICQSNVRMATSLCNTTKWSMWTSLQWKMHFRCIFFWILTCYLSHIHTLSLGQ